MLATVLSVCAVLALSSKVASAAADPIPVDKANNIDFAFLIDYSSDAADSRRKEFRGSECKYSDDCEVDVNKAICPVGLQSDIMLCYLNCIGAVKEFGQRFECGSNRTVSNMYQLACPSYCGSKDTSRCKDSYCGAPSMPHYNTFGQLEAMSAFIRSDVMAFVDRDNGDRAVYNRFGAYLYDSKVHSIGFGLNNASSDLYSHVNSGIEPWIEFLVSKTRRVVAKDLLTSTASFVDMVKDDVRPGSRVLAFLLIDNGLGLPKGSVNSVCDSLRENAAYAAAHNIFFFPILSSTASNLNSAVKMLECLSYDPKARYVMEYFGGESLKSAFTSIVTTALTTLDQ